MYTLKDYLKYYKNVPIDKVDINDIDNLLFSTLVYLPIKGFETKMNLSDFITYSTHHKVLPDYSTMGEKAFEILDLIKSSERYKNLVVSDFINVRNEMYQFGAVRLELGKNTIIAFKGTDASSIGWFENFRLGYKYPTSTQEQAISYLKKTIKKSDKKIYITGHSKGGNLALVSAYEMDSLVLKRINKVYNFDGPGLLKKQYESEKYNTIKSKIKNIVPTGSVVGMLLYNENYEVVQSENFAFYEHYPTSWNIFGEFFVEGKLSKLSNKLHLNTIDALEELNETELEEAIETIIKKLDKKYDDKFEFNLIDFKNIIKNMKDVDPKVIKYLTDVFTCIFNITNSNEKGNG